MHKISVTTYCLSSYTNITCMAAWLVLLLAKFALETYDVANTFVLGIEYHGLVMLLLS